jgi:STAS domain
MRNEGEVGGEELLIRLDGVFDGPAARRVEATLARARPGTRFRIDLTHIREFHDFGVMVLANAVTRCPVMVALRGLRTHQIRLLRYFGVKAEALEAAPVPEAA